MNYFNLLNRVRFQSPNNNNYGSNIDNASNFGYIQAGEASGHNARQGQLSGRVTF